MKASETKLQPVIEGTKQYIVPLFQRTYTWDKKEWDTLWDDIVEISADEDGRDHFIGSIVTMPTHSVPEGVAKFLLIDGQQRLTTLYVLLSALRDAARILPGTLADEIEEVLLTNRYKTGNDSFKLLPTQGDRQSFVEIIGGNSKPQEGQIARAYRFFERKLRGEPLPRLEVIKRTIVERLVLVSIVLDRDDNPYLIFESLNAKGRPLSQADLIRNYFFMRIHVEDQDPLYQTYWKPMQDDLGEDLTEYIRHFLMKDGAIVKQGDVYFALKERADKERGQQEVIAYLQLLVQYGTHYARLLRPDEESSSKIRHRMHRLNRIEVTTAYPFLLNLFHDRAQERLSEDELVEILDLLENFLVRRFVCGVPTNQLNKIFPALYSQASHSESLVDGVRESLRTKNYPRDAEFRERLVSSKLYGAGDRIERTKIILERLEASFDHKEAVPFDQLTIEHVMPQTLTAWWKEHLGPSWEITYETLLDTLGNLTLTAYNSPLSNEGMQHKREILGKSHLELNRYFASVSRWDEGAIRHRAATLADRALSIWRYFGLDGEDSNSSSEEVTGRSPVAVIIFGQRFAVGSWRDVAQRTLETVAELDEDRMLEIASQFPRLVGKDPSKFRSSRQLANGLFMEVHLSAAAIYRFCIQVAEVAELSSDDWQIELVEE